MSKCWVLLVNWESHNLQLKDVFFIAGVRPIYVVYILIIKFVSPHYDTLFWQTWKHSGYCYHNQQLLYMYDPKSIISSLYNRVSCVFQPGQVWDVSWLYSYYIITHAQVQGNRNHQRDCTESPQFTVDLRKMNWSWNNPGNRNIQCDLELYYW